MSGSINSDSGMICLNGYGNNAAFPSEFNFSPVPVTNGKFRIEGKITNPSALILILRVGGKPTYISGVFFIDRGSQKISCNVDSIRKTPGIHNATMAEYLGEYCSIEYRSIDTVGDYYARNVLYGKYLQHYALRHPDSYVALWEVSGLIKGGYNEQSDSAFSALSNKIKFSNTGKFVADELSHLRLTKKGAEFPTLKAVDLQGQNREISFHDSNAKFTLVDFWFAHCSACLSEFPDYINIFDKYQNKGFSMTGISIDTSKADVDAWRDIIKNKSLNWNQFRVSSETINNLRIALYPTNFLLDYSGKIIASDMDTKQLADFLHDKLK